MVDFIYQINVKIEKKIQARLSRTLTLRSIKRKISSYLFDVSDFYTHQLFSGSTAEVRAEMAACNRYLEKIDDQLKLQSRKKAFIVLTNPSILDNNKNLSFHSFYKIKENAQKVADQINWDDVQSDIIKQNRKQMQMQKQDFRKYDQLNQVLAFNESFEEDPNCANPFDFLKKLLFTPAIIMENIEKGYCKGLLYLDDKDESNMGFTTAKRLKFI